MTLPEPRNVLAFVLLLAGAVGSTFLVFRHSEIAEVSEKPTLSLAYYLDNAELTGTTADGSVLYRIRADRAEQNTTDASIEMRAIDLDYGPVGGPTWNVRANAGRIPAAAEVIELAGDVTAVSGDLPGGRTEIRTQQLDIHPDTMLATTPARVAVLFDGHQLNGTGMEANFRTNRLNLLANVNGKFTP
ncbi:MAG: LPS export ABC transporter periplasmic protein LptC [Gammaproteobacteria bacterium]|jgi:LPS export ABC transporter protein LptC|nr:LPS export ABC transporter periplasmic protein LptC [Gammaproteobacteria bacterium]